MRFLKVFPLIFFCLGVNISSADYSNQVKWVVDSIEYTLATDKYEYTLGETVGMMIRLVNLDSDSFVFVSYELPDCVFSVFSSDESFVWWTYNGVFYPIITEEVLQQGDTLMRVDGWGMADMLQNQVDTGIYYVNAAIHPDSQIWIIIEPPPFSSPYVEIKISSQNGIEELDSENERELDFSLSQNYPNPFNPSTTIPFQVKSLELGVGRPYHTTLTIFNILGQKVRTLVDEEKLPGDYRVVWDGKDETGKDVASGIYFYQLKVGEHRLVKRMLLLR